MDDTSIERFGFSSFTKNRGWIMNVTKVTSDTYDSITQFIHQTSITYLMKNECPFVTITLKRDISLYC